MHAQAVLAGVDLGALDLPDALGLLFAWSLDALMPHGMVKPITKVELALTLERRLWDPYHLTEESFGTGPTAEAGQAAMMALFPAPAPARPG